MMHDGRSAPGYEPDDGDDDAPAFPRHAVVDASGFRPSDWIPPASALIAGALGAAVLTAWALGVTLITHASPAGVPMTPLTALGLIIGALALWLLHPLRPHPTRRGVGDVLAGLLGALGVAVLIEHLGGVDLGIDLLLYPNRVAATDSAWPGRPSLNAGASYTLLGAALLLLSNKGRPVRVALWLALGAFLIGAAAALGYLYRVPDLYRPMSDAPMPLHGAIGVIVLSIGLLFARRRVGIMGTVTGSDVGGVAARRLLPIGVLLPVMLGALVAEGVRAGNLSPAHGFLLVGAVLAIAFALLVGRSALVLRGIDRERQRAARGLVQSEERFRSLAENASDAMITIDARGAIVFANPAAEKLFGYSQEELARMHLTNLMPERFRDGHREGMHRLERTGKRRLDWGGVQMIGLRRDGSEVPIEITLGDYVRDGTRYFTGIIRDITERKHAETSQRLLVEAGRVLSASLDPEATLRGVTRLTVAEFADWCVVYGGENCTTTLELAARDLVREVRLRELERRYPPHGDAPVCLSIRVGEPLVLADIDDEGLASMAYGGAEHRELLAEIGCQSLLVVPLETRGRTIGALALGAVPGGRHFGERDIATARELAVRIAFAVDNARLYEQARSAREQAESRAQEIERITESRARLLRGFSHDLKNPLGAADGHADLLESGVLGALEPKQRDSVERIRATIRHTLGLIDDLVELARTESGQVELNMGTVAVGRVVGSVVDEQRPRAAAKGLTLDVDEGNAPPARADAARVRQIVGNLLTNAIKYTSRGSVMVRVQSGDENAPAPGSWVRVDVEDTGRGISAEDQARVFDEFSRLSRDEPGAGLGLAISRNLAEAQGGAITLRSEQGAGSCFTLWLRAANSAADGSGERGAGYNVRSSQPSSTSQ